MEQKKLLNIIKNGCEISTSGTTGNPKTFFQSPDKIAAANKIAVESQKITKNSKIYTVSKMTHAGGLLAQTLPAISIGADVVIEQFSPYTFVKEIKKYTHSHIAPGHARAIMGTKAFKDCDLSNIWITCGSDPVTWDIIKAFVEKGATFMANWGMTEIGPIAINKTFCNMQDYYDTYDESKEGTICGDTFYCDHYIENNILYVKGDISVFGQKWYATNDKVKMYDKDLYITGRVI